MTVAQFLAVYRVSLPAGCPPPAVEFISGAIAYAVAKISVYPRSGLTPSPCITGSLYRSSATSNRDPKTQNS